MRFPERPLRGVKAKYARQARCPSYFGLALLDFEPLPDGRLGYAFVNGIREEPADQYAAESDQSNEFDAYVDALNNGIQLHLAGVAFADLPHFRNAAPPDAFTAHLNNDNIGVRLCAAVDAPLIAVRVVLRGMGVHPVDSSEPAFRRAGWLGAPKAVELDRAGAPCSVDLQRIRFNISIH